MYKLMFLLTLSLIPVGCTTDPHDVPMPVSLTNTPDPAFTDAVKALSDEERQTLLAYTLRSAFGGTEGTPGLTIGDVLSDQRAFEAEQERANAAAAAEAAKLERARKKQRTALRTAVTVIVTEKGFQESDWRADIYEDSITMTFAFHNTTDKLIRGVKGVMVFNDAFGDEITRVNVSYDGDVLPGKASLWHAKLHYNQFRSEDTKLRNTALNRIQTTWLPEVVLFADGSSLRVDL